MSGRWLTIIAVSSCVALVAFALWQRARTTEQVRQFWGADHAALIQHGPIVKLRHADREWRDISRAPGLVHLRATLVDDRYFQWNTLGPLLTNGPAATNHAVTNHATTNKASADYTLSFQDARHSVELTIDSSTGSVTDINSQKTVQLIPASAKAVAAYLNEIAK